MAVDREASGQNRPVLSVSVPPEKRADFYRALVLLKQHEGTPFMSASAVVVQTILEAAARIERGEVHDGGTVSSRAATRRPATHRDGEVHSA